MSNVGAVIIGTGRVDDPVGAISVHGVCGAFGTICVGLFATQDTDCWKQGLFYGVQP